MNSENLNIILIHQHKTEQHIKVLQSFLFSETPNTRKKQLRSCIQIAKLAKIRKEIVYEIEKLNKQKRRTVWKKIRTSTTSSDLMLLDDHDKYSESSSTENSLPQSPDKGVSTSRARKRKMYGEKLKVIDESIEELIKRRKEDLNNSSRIQEEKLASFKEFVADAKEFNASVLELLRNNNKQ